MSSLLAKLCKNHVFCLSLAADDYCPQCLFLFGGPLVIKHEPIDCHICFTIKPYRMRFVSGCPHEQCVDCTRRIVFPPITDQKDEDYDDKVNRYMFGYYRSSRARCPMCRSYAFNNAGLYML
jgi:hypothetical protein